MPSKSMKTQTLTKKERIKKRSEFIKRHNGDMVIYTSEYQFVFKPTSYPFSRLGIVVTKRVGNAVFRNRVKRVLRESFRRKKRMVQPPRDVIAVRKNKTTYPTLRETEKQFVDAVKRFVYDQKQRGTNFTE